jgi:hypothetical protein
MENVFLQYLPVIQKEKKTWKKMHDSVFSGYHKTDSASESY